MMKRYMQPIRKLPAIALLAILLFAALPLLAYAAEQKNSPGKCSNANPDVAFICGVSNVEDIIRIDGSRWIIGSSLFGGDKGAALYLFDTKKKTAHPIPASAISAQQDKKAFPDCPAAPDFSKLVSHGLDYRMVNGQRRLYVVNHGNRESIEIFTVTLSHSQPVLQWIGCAIAPTDFWPDAVAALPDGGMVVTSIWDPADKDRVAKLAAGLPVGGLAEWHAATGWKPIGPADVSGPNGVIASADGKVIYIALWSGKKIMRLDLSTGTQTSANLDILADNVRWSADRKTVLLGGQDTSVEKGLACFESKSANCNVPFKIYRIDPATLAAAELVPSGVYGVMGAGTGAIETGHELWVSSCRADRIAIFRQQPLR